MAYRGGRPPTGCFINCPINYYRGSIHKLYKACCTVDATKYYYANVIVWNSLPNCVVTALLCLSFRCQLLLSVQKFTTYFIHYCIMTELLTPFCMQIAYAAELAIYGLIFFQ